MEQYLKNKQENYQDAVSFPCCPYSKLPSLLSAFPPICKKWMPKLDTQLSCHNFICVVHRARLVLHFCSLSSLVILNIVLSWKQRCFSQQCPGSASDFISIAKNIETVTFLVFIDTSIRSLLKRTN